MLKGKRKYKCVVTLGKRYQQDLLEDSPYIRVKDRFDSGHHYVINICSLEELKAVKKYFEEIKLNIDYYIRFEDIKCVDSKEKYEDIVKMFTNKDYYNTVHNEFINFFCLRICS